MSLPPFGSPPPPGAPQEPVEVGRVQPMQVEVRVPQTKPIVTYVIMGVTIFIFLLQMASQYFLGYDYLIALGAKDNELIRQGQLWRFFTPALLHVGLAHIAFNMYALYAIGRGLERYYGHTRFLMLYGIGAFAGNLASFVMSPAPSVGASTALFGLVAAEGVFIYQNRRIFGKQSAKMLGNLLLVVVINLGLGLAPGIDNWGHLGGLVGGGIFALLAGPILEVGGLYPNLLLVDRRPATQVWTVAMLENAALAAVAVVAILN
jgi:rhomboid protease GluP